MQSHRDSFEERGMTILLRYQGPDVDAGTMDVYDAARNMMSFSDFVIEAAHKLYGEDVRVRADVTAYRHASFGTELAFELVGGAMAILPLIPDIVTVAKTVSESIDFYKFLKGEPPASVHNGDDNSVHVTNSDGNTIIVNAPTYHLTLNNKAGKAAGLFVGEALSKPGIHKLELSSDGEKIAEANSDEAQYFHQLNRDDELIDMIVPMGLTVEMPSFKEGSKWKMWNGSESLTYSMEDPDFLELVDGGEPFRKGDILMCDVRVQQTAVGGKLRLQRSIVKVHQHTNRAEQRPLNFD